MARRWGIVACRRRSLLGAALVLVVAVLGCVRDRTASRAGTITIGIGSESELVNPADWEGAQHLVFLPLMALNAEGELEGRLARTWTHSADHREWTYYLRSDVRWHDGVPTTAHDVKFTLDLLTHPDVLDYSPEMFERIEVVDDTTITIRYRSLPEYFHTWTVFFPNHLLAGLDPRAFYRWDFWKQPVGNGPYRFSRAEAGSMMELEANPDYFRGKPRIERVIFRFGRQLTRLLSGEVDAISYANPMEIAKLGTDARFRTYYWYQVAYSTRAILWQHRHPLFDDARVRRALTLALDRRELLQVVNLPADAAIVDGPFTGRQLLRRELPEPLPYNPEAATALLDDVGWQDADRDGVRERDGVPFRFTALVEPVAPLRPVAEFVQSQFRRVGVDMELQVLDATVVRDQIRAGQFDAAFTTLGAELVARYFTDPFAAGYRNSRVVELLERAEAEADPDTLDVIYYELAQIFRRDVPVTYLFPIMYTLLAHRRIRGLSTPWQADIVRHAEDLWLENDQDASAQSEP